MKHLLTICAGALALMLAMPANAQTQFGIKAGLNITSMKIKDLKSKKPDVAAFVQTNIDPKNRCGFFIGPTVDFKLPIVGLGMETSLLYNQKVVEVESTASVSTSFTSSSLFSISQKEKVKQNLLSVPINLKASVGLGSVLGIYGAVGPQFDFNLGGKKWKDLEGLGMEWKNTTASLNLGFGVKVLKHIQAGLTYNIGLSKTAEYTDIDADEATKKAFKEVWGNANAKTNTWMISASYMF